jgi:hypothetical protein
VPKEIFSQAPLAKSPRNDRPITRENEYADNGKCL